jgi:hypothetical protein
MASLSDQQIAPILWILSARLKRYRADMAFYRHHCRDAVGPLSVTPPRCRADTSSTSLAVGPIATRYGPCPALDIDQTIGWITDGHGCYPTYSGGGNRQRADSGRIRSRGKFQMNIPSTGINIYPIIAQSPGRRCSVVTKIAMALQRAAGEHLYKLQPASGGSLPLFGRADLI